MDILTEFQTLRHTGIHGVRGRIVQHVSRITKEMILPDDPNMRYQLGVVVVENRSRPSIIGVSEAVTAPAEPIFHLKAFGDSWENAAANYRRNHMPQETAVANLGAQP